jgi:biopolymer transport protein ExbD
MSHNVGEKGAEPNLVPLLDVVLQLIMFFMITANFVATDQINESIKLPVAQAAVPLDKTLDVIVYLNMDKDANLLVSGELKKTPGEKRAFLLQEKENAERRAKDMSAHGTAPPGGLRISAVLRADRNARYKDVYEMLELCRQAGYPKYQIRVEKAGG